MSMIGQLYPPYRQNYGFGGGGATMNVGMGKEGAKKATKLSSVLTSILPTIRETDYNDFFRKFAQDRGLQAQYVANHHATSAALATLASYEPVSSMKLASAALNRIKPSVAQLRKEAEGYTLKTASHACWIPEERSLNHGEAVRLLGVKIVLAADQTGATTMALQEGAQEEAAPPGGEAVHITEFGIYQVQDANGNQLSGYVFPNLIDIDGTSLPIALFTNGSQMAVQSDIAGIPTTEGAPLVEGQPEGTGVFYQEGTATIPLTIKGSMASPEEGGAVLQAETFDGREVQVMIQPNIEAVTPGPGGELLIPDTFSWLPLDAAEKTALVTSPEDLHKEGSALRAFTSVTVRHGGNCFSVEGFPVEKLAAEDRQFLSLDDTMFLLTGLGTNLEYAQKKLGESAAFSRPVSVVVGREIKTAAAMLTESRKTAAATLTDLSHLQKDLVKEAAVIPDPAAVDTVLALGFINPENLGQFISAIPEIDGSQSKLCELLLAARLGLREVPAGSLEKAIKATEECLEGLKVLAFSA
jgi:hypothetical protein